MGLLQRYILLTLAVTSFLCEEFVRALPAATTSAPTTHIVSYVKQRKNKANYDEFPDFDFESVRGVNSNDVPGMSRQVSGPTPQPPPLQHKETFGKIVEQLSTNMDGNQLVMATSDNTIGGHSTNGHSLDDLLTSQQNTLENTNEIFGVPEQHESPMTVMSNGSIGEWSRNKQNIPVLESVRHLVHSVSNGALNHTTHVRDQHRLVHMSTDGEGGGHHQQPQENESSAIETEEDRETANESTSFQLLDLLGSLGGFLWSIFMNLQRMFANFSSGASASSSSASFGGSR